MPDRQSSEQRFSNFKIDNYDFEIDDEENQDDINHIEKQIGKGIRSLIDQMKIKQKREIKKIKKGEDNVKQNYIKLHKFKKQFDAHKLKQMNEIQFLKEKMLEDVQNEKKKLLDELLKEKQEWEDEKKAISKIGAGIGESIVQLNVRGETEGFTVTKSLLRTVTGSYLDKMFSGMHQIKTVDGKYFIDRDPKMFRYVLQLLSNDLQMPYIENKETQKKFTTELNFMGLTPKTDFQKYYKKHPLHMTQIQHEVWLKLGPFPIQKYIDENKLNINKFFPIKSSTCLSDDHKTYDFISQVQDETYTGLARINFHKSNDDSNCELQEGQMHLRKLHGFGRKIYQNGNYFLGEFKNGQKHGNGKYVYYNGIINEGNWVKGEIQEQLELGEIQE